MKSYNQCSVFQEFIRSYYSNDEKAFVFGPNKKVSLFFGLQDVFALSGFPVNGEPLVCDDEVTKDLCDRYLGEHDKNAKRSMRLSRRWLKEKFEKVPSDVDKEKLAFYVRAYILHLIGTFIMPNVNNRSHYPAYWLCFLEDLRPHALQRVAWGAAAYCKLTWELQNDATSFVGPWWLYE
ncbi:serine/threonine-protein phosphatase 7, partial [Tanacetum coccineum]